MSEIMVPVDPACIPEGWEAVRVASSDKGEFISMCYGNECLPYKCHTEKNGVCLVIRKKYDPGIPLPKGWWVWHDGGEWIASPESLEDDLPECISGLDWLPGFIPPPDSQSRQIN
jgi:hypothetical protein